MSVPNRRQTIVAVLAFLAGPAAAAPAGPLAAAGPGAKAVAASYQARRGRSADAHALERELLPAGWSQAVAAKLRRRIKADFLAGRTFSHRGWVLTETEGKLFVIAANG